MSPYFQPHTLHFGGWWWQSSSLIPADTLEQSGSWDRLEEPWLHSTGITQPLPPGIKTFTLLQNKTMQKTISLISMGSLLPQCSARSFLGIYPYSGIIHVKLMALD